MKKCTCDRNAGCTDACDRDTSGPSKDKTDCTKISIDCGDCAEDGTGTNKTCYSPQAAPEAVSAGLALLYGGMSPEYVANMEKHRNVLADALAEILVASDREDMGRIKEVVAGCILEIHAI